MPAAPANTVLPAITGTTAKGQTLSVSNGTWSGSPTSYAYQWKRDGAAISGATSATYVLVSGDVGTSTSCTVTASSTNGSASATATGVGPIAAATLALDFATGTYMVGSTSYGSLAAVPGYSYTRSGAVSFVNGSGTVSDFAANVPPILSGIGYKAYGALTNYQIRSQAIDQWTLNSATVTADATTAPDGTTTADLVTASASNALTIRKDAAPGAGTFTFSIFLKAGSLSTVTFFDANQGAMGTFTLSGSGTASPGSFIVPCSNGWYRCISTGTATGVDARVGVGVAGAGTFYAWQGEVLAGSFTDGGPLIATGAATASIGAPTFSVSCPNGSYTATYTFDDASTQTISTTIAAGAFAMPTYPTLNRPTVESVDLTL
jgi:hypothetical protein